MEITAEGILLRPKKVIDATQAWFWEPAWQAKEREADEDAAAGRVERFESDEEFLAALERPGLRVKRVQGTHEIVEMTWAKDGRATFQYGQEVRSGERHVIWRRIGTHDILESP